YNNYTDFKLYTTITSFAQDSAGNYWFGTYYSGLVKFDGVSWQNFNTSNSDLPSNRITGISYNSQSGLWIATADTGIVNYDGNNWTNYNTSNSPLISNYTTTIITDNNNKKWIGTTGNGIQYISGNMSQWVNFSYNNSGLLSNNIRKLYFDNSTGKLWILHSTSNIAPQSFDGWIWKSYDTLVSNYDMVWDIQTDDQSNTWFGTTHSLAKLTGTNWAFYNSFNSGLPINGPVISISKDLNGSIWLVNQNQNNYNIAFVNFDGNNWISLDYVDYPIMSRVYFQTVQTDKWGNKWFYINPISGSYLFSALVYKQGGVVLSAEDQTNFGQPIINNFILEQNYPNPFNPSTKIKYVIPNGVRNLVTLKVYDVLGNEVATLVNEEKPAGIYEVEFNASKLSSGIYFYKLQAGSFVETKKMILLK
ncbi:MAG: T9SS type A sorting domain-containing protein, partial [Ignavibacterium sp.]|uniref:two-component regulator propeller domain-containing protein n=1 Tax=Ignavibacterium sp. TaxID=2651167 RepID=UPI003299C5FB